MTRSGSPTVSAEKVNNSGPFSALLRDIQCLTPCHLAHNSMAFSTRLLDIQCVCVYDRVRNIFRTILTYMYGHVWVGVCAWVFVNIAMVISLATGITGGYSYT